MCVLDPAQPVHGGRPSPTLDRMIHLAGAGRSTTVAVCGRAAYAATLTLCGRGFDRVTSICGAGCTGGGAAHDCLVLTGPCTAGELERLVAENSRLLADSGVVVAHEQTLDDDAGLARALEARGWSTTWRVHDLAGPCLVAMGVSRSARPHTQTLRIAA